MLPLTVVAQNAGWANGAASPTTWSRWVDENAADCGVLLEDAESASIEHDGASTPDARGQNNLTLDAVDEGISCLRRVPARRCDARRVEGLSARGD